MIQALLTWSRADFAGQSGHMALVENLKISFPTFGVLPRASFRVVRTDRNIKELRRWIGLVKASGRYTPEVLRLSFLGQVFELAKAYVTKTDGFYVYIEGELLDFNFNNYWDRLLYQVYLRESQEDLKFFEYV